MFLQNIKQLLRSMRRYKTFTIINLLGLSIGIGVAVTLFLIAQYEKSFDNLHSRSENIYRVVTKTPRADKMEYDARAPYPLARLFRAEYAGAQATEVSFVREMNVRIGNNAPFNERNVLFADSFFFKVLDFARLGKSRIAGNPQTALAEPDKALLTESTATKYFGSSNPVGKLIRLDNKADVEIAGIIKDPPATMHLPFSMIVSFSTLTKEFNSGIELDQWGSVSNGYCYIRLNTSQEMSSAEKALAAIVKNQSKDNDDRQGIMYLQPLHSIHFDPTFESSNAAYTVSPRYLSILLLLGSFILLIACINYVNLSTSLAFTKSKEVGIRKTIGASRPQLFLHYLSETFFLTIIAALIGITIAVLVLPAINRMFDKSLSAYQLATPLFIGATLAIVLLVSFISGLYPALILSRFKAIYSLKNVMTLPGRSSTLLRQGLVVFQFTVSVVLIICTMVIARQVRYFHKKELGFDQDAVVEVSLPTPDSTTREKFRTLLQTNRNIQSFSFCLGAPISNSGMNTTLQAPALSKGSNYAIHIIPCDTAYLHTYGLQLLAGRWFLSGEEKNLGSGIVVNQTLLKTLGYKNPVDAVGNKIRIGINDYTPVVIGVIKDFHVSSLHKAIMPVGLMPFPNFYYAVGVRIYARNITQALAGIESAWKNVFPESVYSLHFIDEILAKRYDQETKDYNLFKAFSGISIFICCIGLWGLVAFVVVCKTKEIGIRKVLGASIKGIVFLLSKDFLKLVLLALLIASPIAWYFMNSWLQNFAYKITIRWWIFVLAGVFAIVIALLTICFQAIKAAIANPVKSLRTE